MRKNRMMRAASALLVAVLLTTSTISGTFAKYVTEASGSDTARVAKWGVEVAGMADPLFTNQYKDENSDSGFEYTVIAVDDVVAPGTANTDGVTFRLTGKPEVATKVEFKVYRSDDVANKEAAPTDVVLPSGTYIDYTKAPYTDTFTIGADYHPVRFTLRDANNGNIIGGLEKVTLADIEAYLEGSNMSKNFEANTNLAEIAGVGNSGIYVLTWEWIFDGDDKADTLLGNIAADSGYGVSGASINLDFAIAIIATQID